MEQRRLAPGPARMHCAIAARSGADTSPPLIEVAEVAEFCISDPFLTTRVTRLRAYVLEAFSDRVDLPAGLPEGLITQEIDSPYRVAHDYGRPPPYLTASIVPDVARHVIAPAPASIWQT